MRHENFFYLWTSHPRNSLAPGIQDPLHATADSMINFIDCYATGSGINNPTMVQVFSVIRDKYNYSAINYDKYNYSAINYDMLIAHIVFTASYRPLECFYI